MATRIRHIPTEEPFKKKWSEATTIISAAELANHVDYDTTDGDQPTQNSLKDYVEIVKRLNPAMPDIVIHPENETQCNGQQVRSEATTTFRTPIKTPSEFVQTLQNLHQENNKRFNSVLGDKSDWMLAERSNSRSPPSPALMPRSPLVHHPSPSLKSNVFNFSPERTEHYRAELETESSRVKKRLFEEMALDQELQSKPPSSPSFRTKVHSPTNHHRDYYQHHLSSRDLSSPHDLVSRDHELQPERKFYFDSPAFRSSSSTLGYLPEREMYKAKRRIDVDQEYISTPKRLKSDFEREMGYRYLLQLESDIDAVRNKLCKPETDVQKPTDCTCVIMEKQFLQMAESAYRSVRRNDTTPRGFEQFRKELIQTNEVMKDSMEVLKNIRSFCEHKC